jgi:hypothetical protein
MPVGNTESLHSHRRVQVALTERFADAGSFQNRKRCPMSLQMQCLWWVQLSTVSSIPDNPGDGHRSLILIIEKYIFILNKKKFRNTTTHLVSSFRLPQRAVEEVVLEVPRKLVHQLLRGLHKWVRQQVPVGPPTLVPNPQ